MFYVLSLLTILTLGRDDSGTRLTDTACWFLIGLVILGFLHIAWRYDQADKGIRPAPRWMQEPEDRAMVEQTAAAARQSAIERHPSSGATFGPWAKHARRCGCSVCR